jgi:hypothetical protein
MYALFFEDTGDLIATADRAPHALGLGRLVSREKGRTVVGVLNNKDGTTEACWRFVHGRQVTPRSPDDVMPPGARLPPAKPRSTNTSS